MDNNSLASYHVIEGFEDLNLDLSTDNATVLDKVLESIESLDTVELKSLLQGNPNFDPCLTFETSKLCGIYQDFNFAPGVKLRQNLYLFCFDKVGIPGKCRLISEMIEVLHECGFKCAITLSDSSNGPLAVKNVVYVILRKIAMAMRSTPEQYRELYQLLYDLVYRHAWDYFQVVSYCFTTYGFTKPRALWEIDVSIAVELQEHEKVEAILTDQRGLSMGTLIGPILEKDELAGPPCFVSYPAVWLAMRNGDTKMIELLSTYYTAFEFITTESLLLLKFFRQDVSDECMKLVKSKLPKQFVRFPDEGATAVDVLAISLVAAAEKRDHDFISKELTTVNNYVSQNSYGTVITKQTIGALFVPGSCREKRFRSGDEKEHSCISAMNSPELQNRKCLSMLAIENRDIELLKMLCADEVPFYDEYNLAGRWNDIVLYSSVIYDSVKEGLEKEDYEFVNFLLGPDIGDYVAPWAVYHAAHQNDMELVTTLIARYGDSVMHRKVQGGKTCHQISLLELEECSASHQIEVQKRIIDKLNETSMYQGIPELSESSRRSDTLTLTEITTLPKDKLLAILDSGDYTKVETTKGTKPLLLAYLEHSVVPYDFETFSSIKEKLKAKDSRALANLSDSILLDVVTYADVEFILNFLRDEDVQIDMKISGDKQFEEDKSPLFFFRMRLKSDSRLETCVDSFLSLFEGNLAFSQVCLDNGSTSLAMFLYKEGHNLTTFEKRLLDNAIDWLSGRYDCLPQLANVLSNYDPYYFKEIVLEQLKAIFDYIKLKNPDWLTSKNEVGMNLPMYLTDSNCNAQMILHVIESGLFDINAKAEVSPRVAFELQHIHGKIRPGKKRNTLLSRGQVRLKAAKVYNQNTGEYQAVEPKFRDPFSACISTHPMTLREGTRTKRSHIMLVGKRVKIQPVKKSFKPSKRIKEDTKSHKEQFQFVPEHLETTSLVTDGSGLRSRRGRKYKVRSDVETQAVDLGGSNLEELLTPNYAVNTNVLSLALKRGGLGLKILTRYYHQLDVMHRDNDKVSPLILSVKVGEYSRSYETVDLIIQRLDEQISELSKYDSWVTRKGVRSTRDYLLQDFEESESDYHGKTARQIAEESEWTEVVELIDSRLNAFQ